MMNHVYQAEQWKPFGDNDFFMSSNVCQEFIEALMGAGPYQGSEHTGFVILSQLHEDLFALDSHQDRNKNFIPEMQEIGCRVRCLEYVLKTLNLLKDVTKDQLYDLRNTCILNQQELATYEQEIDRMLYPDNNEKSDD